MIDAAYVSRVEARLGEVLGLEDFRVTSARSVSSGLSRSVVLLSATARNLAGECRYAMLNEQQDSPVAPNSEGEFAILRALMDHPQIKAPAACWIERDASATGNRFLLIDQLPGIAHPPELLKPSYRDHAPGIVRESFAILGRLAAIDYASLSLPASHATPEPGRIWEIELDRWEQALRDSNAAARPVTAAAIRHLRRSPPPVPDRVTLVHGDYRVGNFLFDTSGVTGVLDWEMAHPGNPLEDLAWYFLPHWEFAARPGLAGGYLSHEQAIAVWEECSGITVNPAALRWWTMLCHLKAVATWAAMRHIFTRGISDDPRTAMVSYGHVERQESHLARMLA
ncbi:phosphotransferase family protein [Sphingobium sp.]|uniref:phosphotransferase family protein n=1 Tax=Sphingobium sp. TaxID=1912891 RepID=UPI0028BF1066|nr:phosphotransferase family protein [Sphingobium sp.]